VLLPSLTGLRFLAASAVLLGHSTNSILPIPGLFEIGSIGPVGVGFFFVLSGFILTFNWNTSFSSARFFFKRAARILPLHLVTTVIALCQALLAGTPYWLSTTLSLFLVQAWLPETFRLGGNGVSWSLSVEVFFYMMFPLIIFRIYQLTRKKLLIALCLTLLAMSAWMIAYAIFNVEHGLYISALSPYTNPAYRFGEFFIGCLMAVSIRNGWRPNWSIHHALLLGALGYLFLSLLNGYFMSDLGPIEDYPGLPLSVLDLMYLPFALFLITAAATSYLENRSTPLGGKWFVRLGKWSFALYLIQMIVIKELSKFGTPERNQSLDFLIFFLAILLSIFLSAVLYYLVENPAEKGLNSWFAKSHP
jgi:peptidoglycan/LPS O-acetylase OafA/YrhL